MAARLEQMQADGALEVLLGSNVQSIEVREVRLEKDGAELMRANDAVIVCAGGELPTPLLRQVGIEFNTKFGSR